MYQWLGIMIYSPDYILRFSVCTYSPGYNVIYSMLCMYVVVMLSIMYNTIILYYIRYYVINLILKVEPKVRCDVIRLKGSV